MKRDLGLFMEDISKSIDNIENFIKGLDKERFTKDILIQSAVIRQLEIIGESIKNIPLSFREKYPQILWKDIAGLRDALSHSYFGVIIDRIWKIIKEDMPELKKEIGKIQKSIK